MATVVIDPGHGGAGRLGGATGTGVIGARGTREKDVTLAVARVAAEHLATLGHRATLTRDDDRAVALDARSAAARAGGADAFVSIHFDTDPDPARQGSAVWIHDRAEPASERLAGAVAEHLAHATGFAPAVIQRGPLRVLGGLGARAAHCHAEISFLSDPAEEARLADQRYMQRLGAAVATAIAGALATAEPIDLYWEVPLVPQVTGMSCWAAAAAMLIGWRDSIAVDPEEVARASGRWAEYRDGLEPGDVRGFAQAWHLHVEAPAGLDVDRLHQLVADHGPLWVGEASPGLHVVVVAGMVGDGTPDGTRLRILDPWPLGRGERYQIRFRDLARTYRTLAGLTDGAALLLHAGGRRH